jgi:26S proteasome regulatory subunit N9
LTLQEVLTTAKSVLDKTAGADVSVYSNYYRAWAAYYKVLLVIFSINVCQLLSEPEEFYKSALQYVAYTPLDTLPKAEVAGLAFDLGLAALLGENIFNFGDLLEHPLMDALHETENQWLADVIFTFNRGQITKWKELQNTYAEFLNKQQGTTNLNYRLKMQLSARSTNY